MGLLTDIYNTVAKFFKPQEELEGDASKSVATNRLKLVLMQDRTNLTPKILEQMRGELVDLLSKYLEMDKELLELNFEQEGDQVALMLSIPVIRAKDEEEIEAALESEKSDSDDENEEDYEDEEDLEEDENPEETGENTEENIEKPVKKVRKRRKKEVTSPEELENTEVAEAAEENSESEEVATEG